MRRQNSVQVRRRALHRRRRVASLAQSRFRLMMAKTSRSFEISPNPCPRARRASIAAAHLTARVRVVRDALERVHEPRASAHRRTARRNRRATIVIFKRAGHPEDAIDRARCSTRSTFSPSAGRWGRSGSPRTWTASCGRIRSRRRTSSRQ